jgi:hypothetical protein
VQRRQTGAKYPKLRLIQRLIPKKWKKLAPATAAKVRVADFSDNIISDNIILKKRRLIRKNYRIFGKCAKSRRTESVPVSIGAVIGVSLSGGALRMAA